MWTVTWGRWGEWGGEEVGRKTPGDRGGLEICGGGPRSGRSWEESHDGLGGKGGRKIVPELLRTTPLGDC